MGVLAGGWAARRASWLEPKFQLAISAARFSNGRTEYDAFGAEERKGWERGDWEGGEE